MKLLSTGILLLIPAAQMVACAEERIPQLISLTDTAPRIPLVEPVAVLPDTWQMQWIAALNSPEEDLRRECAEALIQEVRRGNHSLEAFHQPLTDALNHSAIEEVRLTLASALIALNVSGADSVLAEAARTGGLRAQMLIEPALVQWKSSVLKDDWLERLKAPLDISPLQLVFAANGLAVLEAADAVAPLQQIVLDRNHIRFDARLAAADALGHLAQDGLVDTARVLLDDTSPEGFSSRLIAVRLLAGHHGPACEEILLQAVRDQHPLVAAAAVEQLTQLAPEKIHPLLPELLHHSEPNVRRFSAQSLMNTPSESAVSIMGNLLSDRHPDVRQWARTQLLLLFQEDDLQHAVIQTVHRILAGDDWRALQQAAQLAGTVHDRESSRRMTELLDHERSEVRVTAAWALREMAVPDTLPGVHQWIRKVLKPVAGGLSGQGTGKVSPADDAALGFLFELIGRQTYSEAVPELIICVPKRFDIGPRGRSAAIWALGLLFEDQPEPRLVRELLSRAGDTSRQIREHAIVRATAAVSLGRIGDPESVEPLRAAMKEMTPGNRIYESAKWAVGRITGTPQAPTPPRRAVPPDPFLRPVEN